VALTPRLRAFLRRLSGSADLADDLTQETFLHMHRARGSFAHGGAVVPWSYAIARNAFISHTRAKKHRFSRQRVDVSELDLATGPELDAEARGRSAAERPTSLPRPWPGMPLANREAFVLPPLRRPERGRWRRSSWASAAAHLKPAGVFALIRCCVPALDAADVPRVTLSCASSTTRKLAPMSAEISTAPPVCQRRYATCPTTETMQGEQGCGKRDRSPQRPARFATLSRATNGAAQRHPCRDDRKAMPRPRCNFKQ